MKINHYQILGIPENADIRQIKAAYRCMAKRFHPDTNSGSEAAAELFRQLTEAYRVLSDEQLRATYDRSIKAEPPPASPSAKPETTQKPKQTIRPDPQQKFNGFLNSLLNAIFEDPETVTEKPARASPVAKPARKVRSKPDFNFYYYLEMERSGSPYSCGEDGIYRRTKETAATKKSRTFKRGPRGSFISLLLIGLWEFLK